ncbi:MAG: hypothetical protein WCO13_05680 [Bacteroidota bacterium]
MENTTYNTLKALRFINSQFKNQISCNSFTKWHICYSNYLLIDFNNSRNEIETYNSTNKVTELNTIFKLAKENDEMYLNSIINFEDDEFISNKDIYVQRYKIENDEVSYFSEANINFYFTKEYPPKYQKEYQNFDFAEFSHQIIEFINEIQKSSPRKSTTLLSICNEDELKKIRKILIKEKIISDINENDFLHHFTGQPRDENINKIEFIKIGKENKPNKSILFTLISELINEKSVIKFSQKINYSFRDINNNSIKLNKNDNRFSLINNDFNKLCTQAKNRLNI